VHLPYRNAFPLSPRAPRERAGVRGLFSLVPKLELGNEGNKPT
jgi:hypothetical protein